MEQKHTPEELYDEAEKYYIIHSNDKFGLSHQDCFIAGYHFSKAPELLEQVSALTNRGLELSNELVQANQKLIINSGQIEMLTEQVENLKEKVLTLDRVLKENHEQAQQQWEQDQAKISRLREGIQKFVFHWRKYFDSPKVGQPPDLNDLESLLSKFPEVPNE